VTQVRRGGEDVVLSRRALLEEQQAEEAKAVRATLVEGAIMQGRVASIANFGAFVDLGAGVLGLAHVTELAHRPVTRVSEVVRLGDTVQVKVLKVDDEKGRISLSLRQATKDPWADVKTRYQAGESYQGAVRRVADFGAFVELEPGVEALAPASEFPPAPDGWKSGLEIDTTRQWVVLAVDPKARRISLALPGPGGADVKIDPDVELSGTVQRVEGYGAFVWLRPGSVGLMPREWSGMREGADFRSQFHIGQQVDVRIVDVGEGGRKIRLARKGVEARAEKPQVKRQKRAPHPEPKKVEEEQSFGLNLGDKLRAALKK
jgi:small subunit ribosomal protein S1